MDPPFTSRSKTGINSFHPRDHPCCDPSQQDWRRSPNRPPSASGLHHHDVVSSFGKKTWGRRRLSALKQRKDRNSSIGRNLCQMELEADSISWYNTVCFNQKMSNITTSSAHFQLRWSFSAEGFLTQPFKTGETPAVSTTRYTYLVKFVYKEL